MSLPNMNTGLDGFSSTVMTCKKSRNSMSKHLPSYCIQLVLISVGKLTEDIILLHNNAYSHVAKCSDQQHGLCSNIITQRGLTAKQLSHVQTVTASSKIHIR
jgi:hypothetical protein